MHKFASLVVCLLSVGVHLAHGQFGLSGSGDSSGQFPRIKLAGPLGQLIGGQGISLNSGLGQVLSSIINTAANAAGSNSNSASNPLQQLATAASSNYINAIRALPFGQFVGGGSSQGQQQQQQQQHSQYNGPSGHGLYNQMQNPINFLTPDSNLFGSQHGGYDGNHNQHHNAGHGFGQNAFPHFSAESKYHLMSCAHCAYVAKQSY